MNMKKFIIWFYGLTILFYSGCGLQKKKKKADYHYALAVSDLECQDFTHQKQVDALVNLDKAISCFPTSQTYALKATLLFKLNHLSEAELYFKKAICLAKTPILKNEIRNNYACLLAEKGDLMRARSILNELRHNPYYSTPEVALVNIGKCFSMKKEYSKALEVLNDACALAPNYVDAHYYKAVLLYFYMHDYSQVKNIIDQILTLEPEHKGAHQLQELIMHV